MSRRARFTCWFSIGSVDSFEQKLDDIQDELDINPRDNVCEERPRARERERARVTVREGARDE